MNLINFAISVELSNQLELNIALFAKDVWQSLIITVSGLEVV